MKKFRSRWRAAAGFSLIEMAIMLAVLGMVLLGGGQAIRAQLHKRQFETAQEELRTIQSALLGFVTLHGRLPCADASMPPDGAEDTAPCRVDGVLPWRDLQVKPVDSWGHLYGYRVTLSYADPALLPAPPPIRAVPALIAAASTGAITVRNEADSVDLASNVPVLVLSHGRNGLGALSMNGVAMPAASLPAEQENNDGDATFRFGGDDQLIWLPHDVIRFHAYQSGYIL
ncbi:MAG: hypothetical protein HQL91_01110 [Magnetococcales bacterium]|nr:hypothetical protein [Magnetococcales bacterium]